MNSAGGKQERRVYRSTVAKSIAGLWVVVATVPGLAGCGVDGSSSEALSNQSHPLVATGDPSAAMTSVRAAGSSSAPPVDVSVPPLVAAASEVNREVDEWRQQMVRTPHPKNGCFQATHPGTSWVEVPCATPPAVPFAPQSPQNVGGSANDVSTTLLNSSTITWAEGSFPLVTGVSSSNTAYSLQMNTNFLPSAPMCRGASNPSKCSGWQQFLYASPLLGGANMVYIEYWLLNFDNPCPWGWLPAFPSGFGLSCFTNSAGAVSVPPQPLSNLQNLVLTATAGSSSDSATLSVGGTLFSMSWSSLQNLAGQWMTAEFNVVGDGNGSQVAFDPGSTVVVKTRTNDTKGTRQQPGNTGTSFTAESNNLTIVPGSVCTFGGDHPGIQFMESNVAGVTPPVCPMLASTANPVLVPEGHFASTNINVLGNLVGQTSNLDLFPTTCMSSVLVGETSSPANLAQGIGPGLEYSVPWGTPPGTTTFDSVTCDNGQSIQQTVSVAPPILTASPSTITVLENSCATSQYAGTNLVWANPGYGDCDYISYSISSPLPPGIQASTNFSYLSVCDSSGQARSFDLTVTSTGCGVGWTTGAVHVNVVSCIPRTSCGNSCQAAMSDGCGGTLNCSSNCTGVYTCTAPQGTTAGLACCGPGQYIPAGGTSCVCPSGQTWDGILAACVTPRPRCPFGKEYCYGANACMTTAQCSAYTGCTPAQAKAHACM